MSTISKFAGRVVCTKAQFDALAEKNPNKEYLVTDDDTYVIAPSADGIVGQVLKKTATGTEWADESGGGSSVTVVQELGDSTTAVMSQKAVTDAINAAVTTALNTEV